MANYITVDGGTTNTRLFLLQGGNITDSVRFGLGARKSAKSKKPLFDALKSGIAELLEKAGLNESDVDAIIASGMITSEYGLYELPHLILPASAEDFGRAKVQKTLPEISSIPFWFIPGGKTDCRDLCLADMMRGEETEVIGLWGIYGDGAYLLPGSHSKLVTVENGSITSVKTMMTGEMIAALSGGTILKSAVDLSLSEYDSKYLIMGYESAERLGINEALFKTRILKNLFGANSQQTYGYFLGVLLADEIKAVASSGAERVMIGGKSILKRALAELLSAKTDIEVTVATEQEVDTSTALGAVKIYETK